MAESTAVVANKTIIKIGNSATPEVFTEIPGVQSITPPTQTRPKIVVPALGDAAVRTKVGQIDNGDVTFQFNWIPGNAVHESLYEDYYAGTIRNFRIYYPDDDGVAEAGGYDEFSAHVSTIGREQVAVNGLIVRTVTLAIDGEITDSDT